MRASFILFLVAVLLLLGGCAPMPVAFYVGQASDNGRLSYNTCSLGVVPDGLLVAQSGIEILADIRAGGETEVVQLRFDVAHGHRVRLASRDVEVDPRDGSGSRIGVIDAIDMWDRSDPDGWKNNPARRAGLRPPELLMDGAQLPPLTTGARPSSPVRHYWVATRVLTRHADSLWLKLPDLTVDGAPVVFDPIRFDRHVRVVMAPLNC
jgi:hypothetical protein